VLRKLKKFILVPFLILIAVISLAYVVTNLLTYPSNDRDWTVDQAKLPFAVVKDNLATVYNIRNFSYASTSSYTPRYYDKTFDLDTIKKVWYVVEPFSGFAGSAHTFLSFEFEGNPAEAETSQFVSISVEIRKEKGESFSAIKGLFNQYELMYVIADERDVIKLRSNFRKDQVFVYPIKTTPEKTRALFLDMLERANKLKDKPEFYNTLTNTCTTNIVKHVNTITPHRAPLWNFKILLPANSDKLAYDLGLIDTDLSFEQARLKFNINARAEKYADDPNFSVKIRQ
jgi:hypothetical protein